MASARTGSSRRTGSLARALADKLVASVRGGSTLQRGPSLRGEKGPATGKVYRLAPGSPTLAGASSPTRSSPADSLDDHPAADSRRRVLIGRGAECDIVILDVDLSRVHAAIEPVDGQLVAIDLGSKNGTWVGMTPLVPMLPHPLAPGAMLRVGSSVLRYSAPGVASSSPGAETGPGAGPEARSTPGENPDPEPWRVGRHLHQLFALAIAIAALAGLGWVLVQGLATS